ncbi:MAG: exodeoxyribonuclease VII small subunit [Anaerolineae bacterium]|jgi:exodeoxyribonuclease VII small subunit
MTDELEGMTFEEAFAELEQMVSKLEGGQLALEDSLKLFERGRALAALCSQKLDEAELKLEQATSEGDSPIDLEG